jgi:hypothetical protein
MGHISEFDHKGKHIIQISFPKTTNLDELKAIFAETKAAYAKHPQGGILCLSVFEEFEIDQAMMDLFEAVAKANAGVVQATAFVGVKGPQAALFKAMIGVTGRQAKLFDSLDAAKDYLAASKSDNDILAGL